MKIYIIFLKRDLGEISPEFYKSYFETFIKQSENYFKLESENFLNNSSYSEYLSKCKTRYQEEKQRIEEHRHISCSHLNK